MTNMRGALRGIMQSSVFEGFCVTATRFTVLNDGVWHQDRGSVGFTHGYDHVTATRSKLEARSAAITLAVGANPRMGGNPRFA